MKRKAPLSKKVIVSNRQALLGKYGEDGLAKVEQAVALLVAADAKRGFATRLVYLDRKGGSWPKVSDPTDQVEAKASVDGVAKAHQAEYLVLLGSHDVVPFQDLRNPLHDPADPESDPDRFAPSDLPYACDAPFSQKVTSFLGPTRVVGRLPDLTGASDPKYLVDLLKRAAAWTASPPPETAFALSAKVWEKSTKLSVRNLLGATPVVLTSPARGPRFPPKLLAERLHFVNCHGDTFEPRFFGEHPKETYADAMDPTRLKGLQAGTVAAFECCYGAELYDPSGLPSLSMANAYLAAGVYGLVASTTIAYGPADANDNADVLCQLFLEQVLRGASLGRAMLEARLGYIRSQSVVDPYDEKTLAQFVLLGDPSIHPFARMSAKAAGGGGQQAKGAAYAARAQRRLRLAKSGAELGKSAAYTTPLAKPAAGAKRLRSALAKRKRSFHNVRIFKVRDPGQRQLPSGKAIGNLPQASTVFIAIRRAAKKGRGSKAPRLEGLLAYEVLGSMVERILQSR